MMAWAVLREDGSVRCVVDTPGHARAGEEEVEVPAIPEGRGAFVYDSNRRVVTVDTASDERLQRGVELLEAADRNARLAQIETAKESASAEDLAALEEYEKHLRAAGACRQGERP